MAVLIALVCAGLAIGVGGSSAGTVSCDYTWKGGNGSWTDGAKWDSSTPGTVPDQFHTACVQIDGSVVHVPGIQRAQAIIVGDGATLSIEGTSLTLYDQSVNAGGVLSGGTVKISAGAALNAGSMSTGLRNAGLLKTLSGAGTSGIGGTLNNTGTLSIDGTTLNGSGAEWTTSGTIEVAKGAKLTTNSDVFKLAGGTIKNDGTLVLDRYQSSAFRQTGGTTTGANPIILNNANFSLTNGSGELSLRHGGTLAGKGIPSGWTLTVQGGSVCDCSTNLNVGTWDDNGTPAAQRSGGTIRLVADDSEHYATITNTSDKGFLISPGAIVRSVRGSGYRALKGTFENIGLLDVAGDLTSLGILSSANTTVAEDATLTLGEGEKFGLIGLMTNNGRVLHKPGGSFVALQAGSIAGNAPIIEGVSGPGYQVDIALFSGSGTLNLQGVNTLTDFVAAGWTLKVHAGGLLQDDAELLSGEAGATGITNKGTIILTSDGDTFRATLNGAPAELENEGTVVSQAGKGKRSIIGTIKNRAGGRIKILKDTLSPGGTWRVGAGDVTIDKGASLELSGVSSFALSDEGELVNNGAFVMGGDGTFTAAKSAKATGTPLDIRNSTMKLTGGVGVIKATGGTIGSDVGAGWKVIEADGTLAFIHNEETGGVIDLDNLVTGDSAAIDSGQNTITNTGTIKTEGPGGKAVRSVPLIYGHLVNAPGGRIVMNGNTGADGATIVNQGTLELKAGTASIGDLKSALLPGRTLVLHGTLKAGGGPFKTNAAHLVLDGKGAAFESLTGADAGLIRNTGSLSLLNGAKLTTAGSLSNSGKLTIGKASALTTTGAYIQTAGSTKLSAPTAKLNATGSAVKVNDGLLTGVGTVAPALRNAALVQPGSPLGTLSVTGAYAQIATGKLAVNVNGLDPGTQYDRLVVGGKATLGGTLAIKTGFTPTLGQAISPVVSASRSGTFAGLSGANINATLAWKPAYGATGASLTAVKR